MSRRPSEVYEKMTPQPPKPSIVGNPIFAKGPALTREILEKMRKNRTRIMGHEVETKQFLLISGLLLLLTISIAGSIAMWFTNAFDNIIFSNLVIVPENRNYEFWTKPSPKPLTRITIYNYTNVEEFQNGVDAKLNVTELGPYVYETTLERINTRFHGDKVSYQEQRVYKFMPELSTGRKQNDRVTVPNIPLFTAASMNKHSSYLARLGLSGLLNSINAKAFITLPAHRFVVGYEDNLYSLSKSYMRFQNQKPYERFGLLSSNIGVGEDVFTINNGAKDINRIGFLERYNGKTSLDYWSTDECNGIDDATDGTFFPPKLVRNRRPVRFYLKEMCRSLPLRFEKEVRILNGKIPAYRYRLPDSVFDSPDRSPCNQCFCNLDSGECPPQGLFNATPCSFGAPVFLSFPRFYNADPGLQEAVEGIDPNAGGHESYVDLHPTIGFVMAAKTRVQANIKVAKAFGISQVNMFEDGQILPVAILETWLEDKTLPEDMVAVIFQTTFTLKSVEAGLKYGCVLTALVTLICILLIARNNWKSRVRTSSIRPLRRHEQVV